MRAFIEVTAIHVDHIMYSKCCVAVAVHHYFNVFYFILLADRLYPEYHSYHPSFEIVFTPDC